MAKTKPIGVRFDPFLLLALAQDHGANSPQKALNFLSGFYEQHKKDLSEKKTFPKSDNQIKADSVKQEEKSVPRETIPLSIQEKINRMVEEQKQQILNNKNNKNG